MSSSSGSAPAFSTRSVARAGANAEEPAPGRGSSSTFCRRDILEGMGVDVMKGSELATGLVTKQCATS
jgi:hypothetical protein